MCKASAPKTPKQKPIEYLRNPILDGTHATGLAALRAGQTSLVIPRDTGLGIGYSRAQGGLSTGGFTGVTPTGAGDAPLGLAPKTDLSLNNMTGTGLNIRNPAVRRALGSR